MTNNYIQEGANLALYFIAVLGILGGIIYLYKHYRNKLKSGYQRVRGTILKNKKGHNSLSQPQISTTMPVSDEFNSRLTDLEQRIESLENKIQAGPNLRQSPDLGNNIGRQEIPPILIDEFITELGVFLNNFKKSRFKQFPTPNKITEISDKVRHARLEKTASEKSHGDKKLNDMNLIYWWQTKGYSSFPECKQSLNGVFGNVKVECVKGQGDNWNLIAISKDEEIYYILLKKSGWMDQIYQEWFEVDEKIVRPGQDIKTLMPPLPKARKSSSGSGWQRVGPKGRVSIE